LSNQSTELTTVDSDFAAIQTAIQSISDALSGSGMNSTVSDPAVASVTVASGAVQGAYTINVSSIGSYATSLSSSNWSVPTSSSGQTTFNLTVGTKTYSFTPTDNSAATVASTINAQFGSLVQATAVNVGSATAPDYRISLQSATLGAMDLDIQAQAGASLQTAATASTGYAISQTAGTWDSSGSPSTYTLAVDGVNYSVSPTDNSAASVAAAINAISGSPVTATVVDVGTGGTPDERIQLRSSSAGISTVDLLDSSGDSLQQQQTPATAGATVSQTAATWDATADPSGNPTQYTLTLGGTTQTFSVTDNSAESVAAAINGLAGSPVQANVVDVGTASQPDYRIQLIDNTGSGKTPQLSRSTPFDLQMQGTPPGSLAQYEIANSGKTVTSNSRNVAIATGTTLTLTGTGSTDVTVSQSISTMNTALSGFADAYNAAVAELAKQYGQSGGALQGNSIVYSLSRALASMSTYNDSSSNSLTMSDLGFTLNVDGTLSYSPLTMMSTDLTNSNGLIAFLGSATGGGFLKAATDAINSIETPVTGLLKSTETAIQSQITDLGNTITTKQAQIDQLRTNLTNQMAKADAAIASMEQEYSYLTSVYQAQLISDQMYANGA
jgi:flagellar hook-associated protein 2